MTSRVMVGPIPRPYNPGDARRVGVCTGAEMNSYGWIAAVGAVGLFAFDAYRIAVHPRRLAWWLPAVGAVGFLLVTIRAVVEGGPTGFWPEHTEHAWGNQVWFDLVLAASVAWLALLPRARAAGMNAWAWLACIILSGSLGLLAMFARLLWLEQAHPCPTANAGATSAGARAAAS